MTEWTHTIELVSPGGTKRRRRPCRLTKTQFVVRVNGATNTRFKQDTGKATGSHSGFWSVDPESIEAN